MIDNRITKLAELLLDYSIKIKKGERLYLEWKGVSTSGLVEEIIKQTARRGAIPIWIFHDEKLLRAAIENSNIDQMKEYARLHCNLMDEAQCYLGINGSDNPFEMASMSRERTDWFVKYFSEPVHNDRRIKNTRWCVLRWPSVAMAQMAQMSHEEFINFYFDVCLVDYKKLSKDIDPIARLLEKTEHVRVVSPGTDLSLSVKGMPVIKCDGGLNIPDGEIFTAPIADSINGTIRFNTPALHRGVVFSNITITFKNGRAEKISCDGDSKVLNKIFDIDDGAKCCGEFAIGLNPKIKKPMKDPLFDEKIDGSIHMAMGNCYDAAPNGVKSAIHWDLVLIQTPEFGGGELWFDGKLARRDGKFVK